MISARPTTQQLTHVITAGREQFSVMRCDEIAAPVATQFGGRQFDCFSRWLPVCFFPLAASHSEFHNWSKLKPQVHQNLDSIKAVSSATG